MLIIFFRALLIFFVLLIVMRLMGKRQIGEMQPFELVITLLIADLACSPMADISIPILYGVISILAMFVLHQAFFVLEHCGTFVKKLVSGKPSLVIGKDGLDYDELKRNDLDVNDVMEAMRALGYFSLSEVAYAILEANGRFSALAANAPKGESVSKEQKPPALSMLLVSNGKLNRKNLELIHKDASFVEEILQSQGVRSVKTVLALTVDSNGDGYLQERYRPYQTFSCDVGDALW